MGVSATDGVGKSESNESWTDVLLVFSKAVAMDSHWGGGGGGGTWQVGLSIIKNIALVFSGIFFENKNKLKKQKTDLSFNNL